MEKTRFYQFTQSELYLMFKANSLYYNEDKSIDKNNVRKLKDEIAQQININEWNKSQFETKKRIEELEKELTDLKKLLNN